MIDDLCVVTPMKYIVGLRPMEKVCRGSAAVCTEVSVIVQVPVRLRAHCCRSSSSRV